MANQPHVTEEITLTAHPMDAWRTALDALIACAPGDEAAIAWHLADASSQLPANRGAIAQLQREATRANGKCLVTESQAKKRLAEHRWSAPTVRLAIRDISALIPEHMRLIIQEVLRSQSLEQQNGLIQSDIGSTSQAPIGDANDLPASTLADNQARDGVQGFGQQASSLGAVDQPDRGSLTVGQPTMVDETVVEPGPVRPRREVDVAPVEMDVSLHVDAGISDGQLHVHGSPSL